MFCPKCGTENDENAKYCEVCGQSLQKSIPKPKHEKSNAIKSDNSQESKRSGTKRDIIGLGIIGSIVLVLALVLFIAHSSTAGTTSTSTNYITGVYNESGIYFNIPDGWEAYNGTGNYIAKAFSDNVSVFIYRYNDSEYENAKDLADIQAEHFRYWNVDPIITNATINGDKGYSVFGYEKSEEQYEDHYMVKKGKYTYDLTFSMDSNTDDAVQAGIAVNALSSQDVNKILDSFDVKS